MEGSGDEPFSLYRTVLQGDDGNVSGVPLVFRNLSHAALLLSLVGGVTAVRKLGTAGMDDQKGVLYS